MIDVLEDAIRKARSLPTEIQEEIAYVVLAYIGSDQPVIQLSAEEEAELAEADAEIARGDLATDAEVAAVLDKFKL